MPIVASILLVDDNTELRSVIARSLRLAGHQVFTAENGKVALAILPKVTYDIVLTDIVMPDIEGLELIRSIRKVNPAARIVAMSGGGRGDAEDYLAMARNFGAAATLEKPFQLEDLAKTIDSVLERSP
jgi:DNA-binding response OmpR family regulator